MQMRFMAQMLLLHLPDAQLILHGSASLCTQDLTFSDPSATCYVPLLQTIGETIDQGGACSNNRGPATCQNGHCTCITNYCAQSGFCVPNPALPLPKNRPCMTDVSSVEPMFGTCGILPCFGENQRCFNGRCLCQPGFCLGTRESERNRCMPYTETGTPNLIAPAPTPKWHEEWTDTVLCRNTCEPGPGWASQCADGGIDSASSLCDYGTDCDKCGPRSPALNPKLTQSNINTQRLHHAAQRSVEKSNAMARTTLPGGVEMSQENPTIDRCDNSCEKADIFSGVCADGGAGSFNNNKDWSDAPKICELGTDCAACGVRTVPKLDTTGAGLGGLRTTTPSLPNAGQPTHQQSLTFSQRLRQQLRPSTTQLRPCSNGLSCTTVPSSAQKQLFQAGSEVFDLKDFERLSEHINSLAKSGNHPTGIPLIGLDNSDRIAAVMKGGLTTTFRTQSQLGALSTTIPVPRNDPNSFPVWLKTCPIQKQDFESCIALINHADAACCPFTRDLMDILADFCVAAPDVDTSDCPLHGTDRTTWAACKQNIESAECTAAPIAKQIFSVCTGPKAFNCAEVDEFFDDRVLSTDKSADQRQRSLSEDGAGGDSSNFYQQLLRLSKGGVRLSVTTQTSYGKSDSDRSLLDSIDKIRKYKRVPVYQSNSRSVGADDDDATAKASAAEMIHFTGAADDDTSTETTYGEKTDSVRQVAYNSGNMRRRRSRSPASHSEVYPQPTSPLTTRSPTPAPAPVCTVPKVKLKLCRKNSGGLQNPDCVLHSCIASNAPTTWPTQQPTSLPTPKPIFGCCPATLFDVIDVCLINESGPSENCKIPERARAMLQACEKNLQDPQCSAEARTFFLQCTMDNRVKCSESSTPAASSRSPDIPCCPFPAAVVRACNGDGNSETVEMIQSSGKCILAPEDQALWQACFKDVKSAACTGTGGVRNPVADVFEKCNPNEAVAPLCVQPSIPTVAPTIASELRCIFKNPLQTLACNGIDIRTLPGGANITCPLVSKPDDLMVWRACAKNINDLGCTPSARPIFEACNPRTLAPTPAPPDAFSCCPIPAEQLPGCATATGDCFLSKTDRIAWQRCLINANDPICTDGVRVIFKLCTGENTVFCNSQAGTMTPTMLPALDSKSLGAMVTPSSDVSTALSTSSPMVSVKTAAHSLQSTPSDIPQLMNNDGQGTDVNSNARYIKRRKREENYDKKAYQYTNKVHHFAVEDRVEMEAEQSIQPKNNVEKVKRQKWPSIQHNQELNHTLLNQPKMVNGNSQPRTSNHDAAKTARNILKELSRQNLSTSTTDLATIFSDIQSTMRDTARTTSKNDNFTSNGVALMNEQGSLSKSHMPLLDSRSYSHSRSGATVKNSRPNRRLSPGSSAMLILAALAVVVAAAVWSLKSYRSTSWNTSVSLFRRTDCAAIPVHHTPSAACATLDPPIAKENGMQIMRQASKIVGTRARDAWVLIGGNGVHDGLNQSDAGIAVQQHRLQNTPALAENSTQYTAQLACL